MKKKFIINYVCEVNYPNSSAYSIHVMKMCDAFSKFCDLNLFVPSSTNSFRSLKIDYKLKNKFNLIKIFDRRKNLNFFEKILFSLKILRKNENKLNLKSFYISRSIVFAIVCNFYKKNIILELHHNLSGLTKFLYYTLSYTGLLNNIKYIFIHKNLIKSFNLNKTKYICLDDAVDINDFKGSKKINKIKNTCVYVGSFHGGKGIELIVELSKKLKNINFHLYGDRVFLRNFIPQKNIKIFGFFKYKNIPNILSKYQIALMPYGDFISGRLKNINLANYISPLKMFDYLASSNIILASDLKVYKHILKHKKNSILIKNSRVDLWAMWINKIFNSKRKYNYIKKNALYTANQYTWTKRATKIINFSEKNF